MRIKERQKIRKLEEAERNRQLELEIKRERQRLINEDNRKRMEMDKKIRNFKKLQVLDKHQRIDSLCSQLVESKNQFIECSRIANEIRVQRMVELNTPGRNEHKKASAKKPRDGSATPTAS